MILMDAGPLVALLDASDQHHTECVAALKNIREPIGTTWPPFTEAMYLLSEVAGGQEALWEMLEAGVLGLIALDVSDARRIRELMIKYVDLPMDLADAALIRVAEREGIRKIFTTDQKDFSVYRLHNKIRPILIP